MEGIERRLKFIYGTEEKAASAKQKIEKQLEKYEKTG